MATFTKAAKERRAKFAMRRNAADKRRLGSLVSFTSGEQQARAALGWSAADLQVKMAKREMKRGWIPLNFGRGR